MTFGSPPGPLTEAAAPAGAGGAVSGAVAAVEVTVELPVATKVLGGIGELVSLAEDCADVDPSLSAPVPVAQPANAATSSISAARRNLNLDRHTATGTTFPSPSESL